MTVIYKIFRATEWITLQNDAQTNGAPIDVQDGYIHFSTAQTVRETAAKHFAKCDGLILAAVEATPLGDDLKWEVSRGGALFPHLYRPLRYTDVQWIHPLILGDDDVHIFPDMVI